jgi:hypothetical protein
MSFEAKKRFTLFFQNVHYIKEIDLNDCLRTIKKVHLVMPMTSNLLFFLHNHFESEKRVEKNKKERKKKLRKKFDTS